MAVMFRDEWDRKAHDVMCIAKYGSPGGSVPTKDVHRAGDLLRGHPFMPAIKVPVIPLVLSIPKVL